MTTILQFMEKTVNLCNEWEKDPCIVPDDGSVSDLLLPISAFDQEIKDRDVTNESESDEAAALLAIALLASLKARVKALAFRLPLNQPRGGIKELHQ